MALAAMPDRAMLGLVRYSFDHVGWNILRFITTKRPAFAHEREVKARFGNRNGRGHNRHIDLDNKFYRKPQRRHRRMFYRAFARAVDLRALVEGMVVSPEANPGTRAEIEQLMSDLGYAIPVQESSFTGYPHVVTDLAEIIKFSGK